MDELVSEIGIPREKLYCVPGNHDVQRSRSKMCFRGARSALKSESDVYGFLEDGDEREALLVRQEHYRVFQSEFFGRQERTQTEDGLGYVSCFEVDDLRIAVVGLNSAWLAEGGSGDEGELLIGESQVRSAIELARSYSPHVIVGLQHHPFGLLRGFDQRPVKSRLEEACHFIHCGHLHEPDATEVVVQTGPCITLTAGASFESRGFRNAYTRVTFDPLDGRTDVMFVQYDPQVGAYEYESRKSYRQQTEALTRCTVEELREAIVLYCNEASWCSGYLAALLLGLSADVPMELGGKVSFCKLEVVEVVGSAELQSIAVQFRRLGRVVRLLHGYKPLSELLGEHGHAIASLASVLTELCGREPWVEEYVIRSNDNVGQAMNSERANPLRHTLDLLDQFVEGGEWDRARELAERNVDIDDSSSRIQARRILGLCLARSTESADRTRAAELYREVAGSAAGEAGDWGALATLLADQGRHEEARAAVREGVRRFPERWEGFREVGLRLVAESVDRDFRDWLIGRIGGADEDE